MTQAELAKEIVKVQTLMGVFRSCKRRYNAVHHLDEQACWNFLRDTEIKLINDYYAFLKPSTAKLQLLRAIQTERDRHYNCVGSTLQYASTGAIIQP